MAAATGMVAAAAPRQLVQPFSRSSLPGVLTMDALARDAAEQGSSGDEARTYRYRCAYQGVPGAYSEMAACKACPDAEPVPCEQFEVAFQV
jgi:hypothetical protein